MMLAPLDSAGHFDVDFARAGRPGTAWWKFSTLFAARRALVDGWAIGQAVRCAISKCEAYTVKEKLQLWNEYRFFLHPADLDAVRPAVPRMIADLSELLRSEIVRLEAVPLGAIEVRLLADTSGTIPQGRAQLACGLRADGVDVKRQDGETTMRFDTQGRAQNASSAGERTVPSSAVVIRGNGETLHLPDGETVVLGRSNDTDRRHLTVPGHTPRVSRSHLQVRIAGTNVTVTALPNAATSVNGRALVANETVQVAVTPDAPVELLLANEVRVELALSR